MGAAAQPWGHRPPDPLPHSGVRVKLCLLLEILVRLIAAPFAGTTPIKRSMTACPHGILTVADFSVRSVVGCAPAFCAVFMRHAFACFSMCLASMAWMRLLLALDRARPARLDAQCHMTPCFRQQLIQLFEAPRPTPGPARGPGSEEPTCTVVQHGRCVLLSAGIHSAGEQAPTTAQAKEGRLAGITSLGPSATHWCLSPPCCSRNTGVIEDLPRRAIDCDKESRLQATLLEQRTDNGRQLQLDERLFDADGASVDIGVALPFVDRVSKDRPSNWIGTGSNDDSGSASGGGSVSPTSSSAGSRSTDELMRKIQDRLAVAGGVGRVARCPCRVGALRRKHPRL